MTATLSVAASHTDSGALTRDDLKALVMSSGIDFEALDTSADFDRLARVVIVAPVDELDVFQVVHPKRQRAFTASDTFTGYSYRVYIE